MGVNYQERAMGREMRRGGARGGTHAPISPPCDTRLGSLLRHGQRPTPTQPTHQHATHDTEVFSIQRRCRYQSSTRNTRSGNTGLHPNVAQPIPTTWVSSIRKTRDRVPIGEAKGVVCRPRKRTSLSVCCLYSVVLCT